jgi:REP element-mobilizing transposase RayT
MARKLRVEYPGALYHVMNRGDHREPIFRDDLDRKCFLETLGGTCAKTGWQVHAYCLMPNHFHLVVETPQGNLVAGMKWLLGTYTGRFNRRHRVFGHLFSGRYKSLVVDGSGTGYLKTVCDYVHLNPVRANLIGREQKLAAYPWSSYRAYLWPARRRSPWLRVDRLLGEYRVPKDSAAGRQYFAEAMEARRQSESGQVKEFKTVRRGWYLGDKAFRQELLEQMEERRGANHYGEECYESAEAKAERIVAEELGRRGWREAELVGRAKGDKEKVAMAARLRRETTMTLKWVAKRLAMGSWSNVSNRLAARRKKA